MHVLRVAPISRRTLLRGAVGGAVFSVALPWLEIMRPRRARAQGIPKRFVCFMKPNGMSGFRADPYGNATADLWTPKVTGANYQFTSLWNGWGAVSGVPAIAGWQDLKNDITVISGVHNRIIGSNGLAHDAQTTLLTAHRPISVGSNMYETSGGGRSMDQVIGDRIGAGTKFRTLEFGAFFASNSVAPMAVYMSFTAARTPALPQVLPHMMWANLFSNGVSGGPTDPAAIDRLRRQRKSVLDAVKGGITNLNQRLGAADRARLDQHLTSVSELQRQVTAVTPAGPGTSACAAPARPATMTDNSQYLAQTMRAQTDMLVMALACDLTRSTTFMLGGGQNDGHYPFIGVDRNHHGLTHSGPTTPEAPLCHQIDTWQMAQMAYLVRSLKSVTEGDKTLLDSTVTLFGSESAGGWHHNSGGYTWGGMTAGKGAALDWAFILAGGTHWFKHGTHIRYRPGVVTHDQLLRSCFEAATGLQGAESASWMDAAYRGNPAPGLRDGVKTAEML